MLAFPLLSNFHLLPNFLSPSQFLNVFMISVILYKKKTAILSPMKSFVAPEILKCTCLCLRDKTNHVTQCIFLSALAARKLTGLSGTQFNNKIGPSDTYINTNLASSCHLLPYPHFPWFWLFMVIFIISLFIKWACKYILLNLYKSKQNIDK